MAVLQATDDDSIVLQATIIHDDEMEGKVATSKPSFFKRLLFRQKSITIEPRTWPKSKKIPIVVIVALAGAT